MGLDEREGLSPFRLTDGIQLKIPSVFVGAAIGTAIWTQYLCGCECLVH